jgi:hypothetical protein
MFPYEFAGCIIMLADFVYFETSTMRYVSGFLYLYIMSEHYLQNACGFVSPSTLEVTHACQHLILERSTSDQLQS